MSEKTVRLSDQIARQAEAAAREEGFTLDEFVNLLLADHFAAQAEAERLFRARAARGNPERALEILARTGIGVEPRPDDRIDAQ